MPCWDPELIPRYSHPPAQGLALTKWTRKLAWHLGGEGVSEVSLPLGGTLRAFPPGAQHGWAGTAAFLVSVSTGGQLIPPSSWCSK